MAVFEGYTGTRIRIEAETLEQAYELLSNGEYEEIEVESWFEDGDDTHV
jgi:hypothetical protein